jgi:hypothetical protein
VVIGIGLAPTNSCATFAVLLAEAATGEKLPPPTRAAVLMALLAIALLGMLLVVIILLGGHWVRRQGNLRRGPAVPPDRRPIIGAAPSDSSPSEPIEADDISTAETVITQRTQHGPKKSP